MLNVLPWLYGKANRRNIRVTKCSSSGRSSERGTCTLLDTRDRRRKSDYLDTIQTDNKKPRGYEKLVIDIDGSNSKSRVQGAIEVPASRSEEKIIRRRIMLKTILWNTLELFTGFNYEETEFRLLIKGLYDRLSKSK